MKGPTAGSVPNDEGSPNGMPPRSQKSNESLRAILKNRVRRKHNHMRTTTYLILFLTVIMAAQAAQVFQFPVVRERMPRRGEPGMLKVSEAGITYESTNNKASLQLPLANIWEADLSHPGRIYIQTYDRGTLTLAHRTTYRFRLREAADQQALARFFAEHLERPVVGQYPISGPAMFEIPVYHRHVLGGTHGTIRISTEGIEFISNKPNDSRTWPYRDIETIGSADPFHFRVTSFAETYTFDLKRRLPQQAYDFAWQRVYQLPGIGEMSGSH